MGLITSVDTYILEIKCLEVQRMLPIKARVQILSIVYCKVHDH